MTEGPIARAFVEIEGQVDEASLSKAFKTVEKAAESAAQHAGDSFNILTRQIQQNSKDIKDAVEKAVKPDQATKNLKIIQDRAKAAAAQIEAAFHNAGRQIDGSVDPTSAAADLERIAKKADAAARRILISFNDAGGAIDHAFSPAAAIADLNLIADAARREAAEISASFDHAADEIIRDSRRAAAQSTAVFAGAGHAISQEARKSADGVSFLTGKFSALPRLIRQAQIAALAAFGAISAFGIKAAADLEQTKVAFQGLLGAGGDEFIKELQDFAARTPFEFEDVAKASQQLIALGKTGNEAINILRTIGDAAAAAGADGEAIQRVTRAITQVQAKGKFLAEEFNQIAEALPNVSRAQVFQNLADSAGISVDKVKQLADQGLVPAKEGIDALLLSLKQVPGAMGAMDRQAETLKGRFSTFKDTIKIDFSNALQDSLPIISSTLDSLTGVVHDQLQQFGPALGQFIGAISPIINELVNALGPVLTATLNTLGPVLASLAPALSPLGEALATIITAFGPGLELMATTIAQIVAALAPLISSVLAPLGPLVAALQPVFQVLANLITQLSAALGPVIDRLLAAIIPVVTVLANSLAPVLQLVGDAIIDLLPALTPLIDAFLELLVAVEPLIPLLAQTLVVALGVLIPILRVLIEQYLARFTFAFKAAAFVMEKIFVPIIANVVVPTLKFLINLVLTTVQAIAGIAAKAFGWVPGLGGKLKQAAQDVENFKNEVNTSLDNITKNVDVTITTHLVTISEKDQNAVINRQARINAALAKASGGGKYKLDPDEKAAIIRQVDAQIAAEIAARKAAANKAKNQGFPSAGNALRADSPSLAENLAKSDEKNKAKGKSAAEKAADAAKKAAIKVADAAVKSAQAVVDGIKVKLKTAQDLFNKLRDQFNEIRDGIRDAFRADNLFDSRSANQFLKRVTRNIAKNTTVIAAQGVLQRKIGNQAGGSEFLKQLFESGNVRLIKNLAGQTGAALSTIVKQFNADNSLATKIGENVAKAFIVAGQPLAVRMKAVQDQIVVLQRALVTAINRLEAATRARARLKAAAGGYFTSATDLEVGEAGREVVLPLLRPGRMEELIRESGLLNHPVMMKMALNHPDFGRPALPPVKIPASIINRPISGGATQPRLVSVPQPIVKVVKERTVNQEFKIYESDDPRLTAAQVAARTVNHMDR